MFHAILGEDISDADTLAIFVDRIRESVGLSKMKIKRGGFGGCSGLLRKGSKVLELQVKSGCSRAYICYDADNHPDQPPEFRYKQIVKLIEDANVTVPVCPVLPIQELEAWLLADVEKIVEIFKWCRDFSQYHHPESLNNPKELLRSLTRHPKTKKIQYRPPTHNQVMAEKVDLELVAKRCPSFKRFAEFAAEE